MAATASIDNKFTLASEVRIAAKDPNSKRRTPQSCSLTATSLLIPAERTRVPKLLQLEITKKLQHRSWNDRPTANYRDNRCICKTTLHLVGKFRVGGGAAIEITIKT